MNEKVPAQPVLSSISESNEQTSVSYPYTRYNTLSANKVPRMIRFRPMRMDEFLKEFLETDDNSPRANVIEPKSKVNEQYQARKITHDDTLDSSDDETPKNILDTAIVGDEEELMPGVARLADTPAKKCSSDIPMTPMSSIFNRMTLADDRTPSCANKHHNDQFKTPVVTNSRVLPSYYNNVSSKRLTGNVTPAAQRIQYSNPTGCSAIKDNVKSLGLIYNCQFSKHKLADHVTPHKVQSSTSTVNNVETPRLNIQASVNRNHYSIPRQTLPVPVRAKHSDVVLREKDLNVNSASHHQRQLNYVNDSGKCKQQQQQENVPQIKQSVVSENQRNKLTTAGDVGKVIKVQVQPGQSEHTFSSLTVRGRGYIMINKIGEGGSCQVYHCLEQDTFQARAVKVVNLAVDPTTASGYINEVKMLRDLQGNNRVIKMFEYEQIKQTLFVVMEKGDVDFSVFLRNIAAESQVQTHIITCYWIEMLKCVKEIHNNGIIHSDLKPSNFLIVGGRLKLIDFGIASRLSSDMTSVIKDVQVGTFNYISPEALLDSRDSNSPGNGKPRIRISYKSDVWSLGCILYQMVYKRTPFHNYGGPWAKISVIIDPNHCIEYPKMDTVPPHLIAIIQSCLVYEMKNRPTVENLLSTYSTMQL
ncbi:Monopolar spindle 1 [Carabus blaptoides fortunei]